MTHQFQLQHRRASYKKGCRCDQCREATRVAAAKWRAAVRNADPAAVVECTMCDERFRTMTGMKVHRTRAHY